MTWAETARLLALLTTIRRAGDGVMAVRDWYPYLADLRAADVRAAAVQLARRRCEVTAADVRAEVFAMYGRPDALPHRPALAALSAPDRAGAVPDHLSATAPAAPDRSGLAHGQPSSAERAAPVPLALVEPLRVACPWCGAPVGSACTVRGSDIRLRKAPAHPLRLRLAGTLAA